MFNFSTKIRIIFLLLIYCAVGWAEGTPGREPLERAVIALEGNVKNDPGNAELWMHLGFAYRKLDRLDQAATAFEKSAGIDPNKIESLFMLGMIYEKQGRTQDALRTWKRYLAVATDPSKKEIAQKHIHQLSQ